MKLGDDGYCFVCGDKNPIGLKLRFIPEGRDIRAEFTASKNHQGYKDIVHGGIVSTLLDEAMVKLAISMGIMAVTGRMEIRFRNPLMVGERALLAARLIKEGKRFIEVEASLSKADNVIIAEATGILIKT